jgi:hypothetical protein
MNEFNPPPLKLVQTAHTSAVKNLLVPVRLLPQQKGLSSPLDFSQQSLARLASNNFWVTLFEKVTIQAFHIFSKTALRNRSFLAIVCF